MFESVGAEFNFSIEEYIKKLLGGCYKNGQAI